MSTSIPTLQSSDERIEDVTFQNLIRRWTAQREWDWVMAANVMYGHILEERDRQTTTAQVMYDGLLDEA